MLASRSLTVQTGSASRRSSAPISRGPQPSTAYALSSRGAVGSWMDTRQTSLELQVATPMGCTSGAPRRMATTMMGNKATGGPFSPLVVVTRNIIGEKDFNKLRGKGISLHSQVIKDFCKQLGVDNRQVQGVIRLAKKNGEKLGFLA